MHLRCLAVLLLLPGFAGGAQSSASEIWPALDVYWRPAERQRTYLALSMSTERESAKREGTVGIYQDYLRLPRAVVRGGYSYTFSTRDASYRESRVVGEVSLGYDVRKLARLLNRSRGELRWVNGAYSYRLRDRIQLQRATPGPHPPRVMPYGTFEAYYDSRYNTIARLGGRVGGDIRLRKPASLDVYLARQSNSRSTPRHVNALGLTLALKY